MPKKGRKEKVVYKYNLKHIEEWRKLMPQKEEPPNISKQETVQPNTGELWRWDTLEDVPVKNYIS